MDDHEILLLCIDFGTTFTGVAYAIHPNTDVTHATPIANVVNTWPGVHRENLSKTPTRIGIDPFHQPDPQKWGYNAGSPSIAWFKLLFLGNVPHNIENSDTLASTRRLLLEAITSRGGIQEGGQPDPGQIQAATTQLAKELVGQYLQAVMKYAISHIASTTTRDEKMLRSMYFRIVFTLPEGDNTGLKTLFEESLTQDPGNFGLGVCRDVHFLAEPEAALYTLRYMSMEPELKTGDEVLVVDVGGGTIDLVTCQITSADPFQMQWVRPSRYTVGGGVAVDARLRSRIQELLRLRLTTNQLQLHRQGDRFEKIIDHAWGLVFKRGFKALKSVRMKLQLIPDQEPTDLRLDSAQIFELYLSPFNDIVREVEKELADRQGPKVILLAGGFVVIPGVGEKLVKSLEHLGSVSIAEGQDFSAWDTTARGGVVFGRLLQTPGLRDCRDDRPLAGLSLGIRYQDAALAQRVVHVRSDTMIQVKDQAIDSERHGVKYWVFYLHLFEIDPPKALASSEKAYRVMMKPAHADAPKPANISIMANLSGPRPVFQVFQANQPREFDVKTLLERLL